MTAPQWVDLGTTPDPFPQRFVPGEGELARCEQRLFGPFIDYTQNVSPKWMAISLRTSAYILWLAETLKPESAVDWGSGFTSYVLRSVCDCVWSVDDNPDWLTKTDRFLKRYRVNRDRLMLADDYIKETNLHDLVIYDFSSGEIRDGLYKYAVGQIAAGGAGIMDDAAHPSHWAHMTEAAEAHGFGIWQLIDWTQDERDRFAALVAKP